MTEPQVVQQEKLAGIAHAESEFRVADVKSRLDKISVVCPQADSRRSTEDSFQVAAGLEELDRTANELRLKYALYIGRSASTQMIELLGEATVTFSKRVSDSELEGGNVLNAIVSSVFGNNYDLIYLLSGALCLSPPAPGLLETVHLLPGAPMTKLVL